MHRLFLFNIYVYFYEGNWLPGLTCGSEGIHGQGRPHCSIGPADKQKRDWFNQLIILLIPWLQLHCSHIIPIASIGYRMALRTRRKKLEKLKRWLVSPLVRHSLANSNDTCDGIFKLLRRPEIDFKESIPPPCVACGPVRQPYSYSVPSSFRSL